MTMEERKLTPAGQGNLQQIKLGIPVVEALAQMAEDPMRENEKLLLRILEQNKDTEYGRKYGFADIHSIEEYQKKVPVSVYDDYAGYILRMSEDGEENLITSGKVVHYNKSSGTVGNPKRIPLTEKAFQVFQKYNGPYRMGLVAKELGEDWINGRNMSIAESIAEIQHVKSGVTYGALSVKMIGEFRPYLGMSFTSPDEAIYPESETNTRYLHARFGLMDRDLTNMAANFLGFLLEVLRYMEQNWELLVNDIEQGTIDPSIKMSEKVRSSLLKKIQPMPERAQEQVKKQYQELVAQVVPETFKMDQEAFKEHLEQLAVWEELKQELSLTESVQGAEEFVKALFLQVRAYQGIRIAWYHILFIVVVSILAFQIPELFLVAEQWKSREKRMSECLRLQTVVLLLIHYEKTTVEEILCQMENFAVLFQSQMAEAVDHFSYDRIRSLQKLKQEIPDEPVQRICDALEFCEELPVEEAFLNLEDEREYFLKKNMEERKNYQGECIALAKMSAYLPMFLLIILKLVVPFVAEGLSELQAYSQSMTGFF